MTLDLWLPVVAAMRASKCGHAAVHVDLRQAVLLALATVSAPQPRVTDGQGQSIAAGPTRVQREIIQTLAKPENTLSQMYSFILLTGVYQAR